MAINAEKLGTVIKDFASAASDVEGAAIVTPDGLPLATKTAKQGLLMLDIKRTLGELRMVLS
jgi:predicted regulator of Ras-like GTPase activity (Roadblock/LC7/MglB family)